MARTSAVREPGTGGELTTVARAGVADVDAAVSTALAAFESGVWSGVSATDRGRVLLRVAELLRERAETFAVAEARNAGKPIGDARWEVEAAAGTFEYFAGRGEQALRRGRARSRIPGSTSSCASRSASARSSSPGTSRC